VFVDYSQGALIPQVPDSFHQGANHQAQELRLTQGDCHTFQLKLQFTGIQILYSGQAVGDSVLDFLSSHPASQGFHAGHALGVCSHQCFQFRRVQGDNLADSAPSLDGLVKELQSFNVGVGIKAKISRGPQRRDGTKAVLPGPQKIGFEAGAATHHPDGMTGLMVGSIAFHGLRLA
jgi:hypothetical protein